MSHVLDSPLFVGNSSKPSLATGVADKLRSGCDALGGNVVPSGYHPPQGTIWRMLAQAAALTEVEAQLFISWLEEAYSAEMRDRVLAVVTAASLV